MGLLAAGMAMMIRRDRDQAPAMPVSAAARAREPFWLNAENSRCQNKITDSNVVYSR